MHRVSSFRNSDRSRWVKCFSPINESASAFNKNCPIFPHVSIRESLSTVVRQRERWKIGPAFKIRIDWKYWTEVLVLKKVCGMCSGESKAASLTAVTHNIVGMLIHGRRELQDDIPWKPSRPPLLPRTRSGRRKSVRPINKCIISSRPDLGARPVSTPLA